MRVRERTTDLLELTDDLKLEVMERKLAELQIQRQLAFMEALHNIDLAITSNTDSRVTLPIVLSHIVTQLEVDAAAVVLFNPVAQTLEYVARQGFRSTSLKKSNPRIGECYAGQVVLSGDKVVVPDLKDEINKNDYVPALVGEGFVVYVGLPLLTRGRINGVLEIFHRAPLELTPDWFDFLNTLTTQTAIAIENADLFENLQRSNMELSLAYDNTLAGWARALELRDVDTEGHSKRVTDLTMRLADEMGIPAHEKIHIRRGALLHDIGKMGVPDGILLKPGMLTEDEWAIMRRHPTYAYEMLLTISFLEQALIIPYCHHERWDGSGYPRGLAGEQIPLSARIFSVADAWDALTSNRPYRKAWIKEKALEHIQEQAGKSFDPAVVDAFLRIVSIRD